MPPTGSSSRTRSGTIRRDQLNATEAADLESRADELRQRLKGRSDAGEVEV